MTAPWPGQQGRQPPVGPAEQGDQRRDEQAADDHRVDEDARAEPGGQSGVAGAIAAYTPGTRTACAATAAAEDGAELSTSAGVSTPDGMPPSASVTSASWAGPLVACAELPGSPRCRDSAGGISATRMPRPASAASPRCRYTPRAQAENTRLARRPGRTAARVLPRE